MIPGILYVMSFHLSLLLTFKPQVNAETTSLKYRACRKMYKKLKIRYNDKWMI